MPTILYANNIHICTSVSDGQISITLNDDIAYMCARSPLQKPCKEFRECRNAMLGQQLQPVACTQRCRKIRLHFAPRTSIDGGIITIA